ncbi:hypothetical protein LTR86_004885 [Recurvomyces mirabilis]|nr:hypothetical protein LTR86_004885 [Recurvomyces mirabilis]
MADTNMPDAVTTEQTTVPDDQAGQKQQTYGVDAVENGAQYEGLSTEPILDGQNDIATTFANDRMSVEADGRRPLQKVWLWQGSYEQNSSKKTKANNVASYTNIPYKVTTDSPTAAGKTSRLPEGDELKPHGNAVEYLEVGIMIGDDPKKFRAQGERTKEEKATAKKAKKARVTMPRSEDVLRVFTPTTAQRSTSSIKYYVGCKPQGGRLFPRVISNEVVFFYSEFMLNITVDLNQRERAGKINEAVGYYTAKHKEPAQRMTAAITTDGSSKWTASNPLVVTPTEHLANLLQLQFSLYQQTQDRTYITTMIKTIEGAAADLKNGPYAPDASVRSFYDFDDSFTPEEARTVGQELRNAMPSMPELDPAVVMTVHSSIRRKDWSGRLAYSDLAVFLEMAHTRKWEVGFTEAVVDKKVDALLSDVAIVNKHKTGWTPSNSGDLTKENYRLVLIMIKNAIDKMVVYMKESAKAVAEQHGGVLPQDGTKGLINKFANSIDLASQSSNAEQLGALHAYGYTMANNKATEEWEKLAKLVTKLVAAAV